MKQFTVRVRRVLTQDADVPVYADNEDEAREQALALVGAGWDLGFVEQPDVLEVLVSYVKEEVKS